MGKFKYESSPGAWYVQGQTPTPEFTAFVDTYLTQWTGFVAETVFDVNCLPGCLSLRHDPMCGDFVLRLESIRESGGSHHLPIGFLQSQTRHRSRDDIAPGS